MNDIQPEDAYTDRDHGAWYMPCRRLLFRAPCLLPAVVVLGTAMGGYAWCLVVPSLLAACRLRMWRVLIACLICIAVVGLRNVLHQDASREITDILERDACVTIQGTVVRSLAHGGIVSTGWTGARVAVYGREPMHCGDVVEVIGTAKEESRPLVPGMFDTQRWMRGQGVCAQVDLVRCTVKGCPPSWAALRGSSAGVRKGLERILMPEGKETDPRRQVLCALVLGDKDGAEASTMMDFQRGGCMHAFAVSGLHVGLVAGILLLFLRLCHVPPKAAQFVLLIGVALYVWITGMAVPAMRACLMLSALLGGRILVRQVGLLNIWCFTGLFLLLLEPWQVWQSGYQLSFAVYAALCVGVRMCMKDAPWFGPDPYIPHRICTDAELKLRSLEYWVRGIVLVSVCAWIGSLPFTHGHFHAFNTYGVLTNIAITPILPVVMTAGLLSLCCSSIPWLCWVADACAVKASGVLVAVVSFFAGLPGSYIPACEARAPQEAMVLELRYGGSVCMLGNPGLLIDCGNPGDARYTVQPLLFHDGFTPAAMLETRRVASRNGGKGIIQSFWPGMEILRAEPGCCTTFRTEAGDFRIYGPPVGIPPSPPDNACPVVTWQSPRGLVVYIGDASLETLESVPEDLSSACCVILGYNKGQGVDAATVLERMPRASVILLPSAVEAGLGAADFASMRVSSTSGQSTLLRLELPHSASPSSSM